MERLWKRLEVGVQHLKRQQELVCRRTPHRSLEQAATVESELFRDPTLTQLSALLDEMLTSLGGRVAPESR